MKLLRCQRGALHEKACIRRCTGSVHKLCTYCVRKCTEKYVYWMCKDQYTFKFRTQCVMSPYTLCKGQYTLRVLKTLCTERDQIFTICRHLFQFCLSFLGIMSLFYFVSFEQKGMYFPKELKQIK